MPSTTTELPIVIINVSQVITPIPLVPSQLQSTLPTISPIVGRSGEYETSFVVHKGHTRVQGVQPFTQPNVQPLLPTGINSRPCIFPLIIGRIRKSPTDPSLLTRCGSVTLICDGNFWMLVDTGSPQYLSSILTGCPYEVCSRLAAGSDFLRSFNETIITISYSNCDYDKRRVRSHRYVLFQLICAIFSICL